MFKIIFITILLLSSSLFAGSISWEERVPVTRVVPVYRTVTIRTPYQVCYDRNVAVDRDDDAEAPAAALIGAVAGGVLGHQFGRGRGRDAATIGGAVVGAWMGTQMIHRHRYPTWQRRRICETRYREHRERRLVRYKNIAWYKGYKIVKFSQRPLRRIRLHLSARY